MNGKRFLGVALMVWSIFSFGSEFPKATLGQEDGFIDISLSIAKFEKLENGTMRFLIKSSLDNQKISFVVDLLPKWDVRPIENTNQNFYWGHASLTSVGSQSDAFIRQVAKLYGIDGKPTKFKKDVPAQVVGLANNPAEIESTPTKMKFFFSSDAGDDLYSEVFINIDLKNRILEFNEKDPEYRAPLLRSIAE